MDCRLAATLKSLRQPMLVIGYGNSLRCDDGVGPQIARAVAAWEIPNVTTIAVHQLTPDLVEAIARADGVIFIDACAVAETPDIQIRPLTLAEAGMTSGHWCEPHVLLAITQALYGYHPRSWWVMVPGVNFELGESLSPVAQQGIEAALEAIEQLIKTARTEPCTKLG